MRMTDLCREFVCPCACNLSMSASDSPVRPRKPALRAERREMPWQLRVAEPDWICSIVDPPETFRSVYAMRRQTAMFSWFESGSRGQGALPNDRQWLERECRWHALSNAIENHACPCQR